MHVDFAAQEEIVWIGLKSRKVKADVSYGLGRNT